ALPAIERPAWVARAIEGGWEGWRVREAIRDKSAAAGTCPSTKDLAALADSLPGSASRRRSLAQQNRALGPGVRDPRPVQLTRADEKALADLLQTLLRLARAHAGGGRSGLVFPTIEEAERAASNRRRSS